MGKSIDDLEIDLEVEFQVYLRVNFVFLKKNNFYHRFRNIGKFYEKMWFLEKIFAASGTLSKVDTF